MKAKTLLLVCVVLLACILFIGARGYGKTAWEYRVSSGVPLGEPQLNALGAQGWELTGIVWDSVTYPTYYFKRPK
jgi:hypothetical protein